MLKEAHEDELAVIPSLPARLLTRNAVWPQQCIALRSAVGLLRHYHFPYEQDTLCVIALEMRVRATSLGGESAHLVAV